jgi:hypothetical protein
MLEPLVSIRAWRVTLALLSAISMISVSIAVVIAAHGTPTGNEILWNGFDPRWSINSGSIAGDQWLLRPTTNSIGLAVHPINSQTFSFQARMTTDSPNLAVGLAINIQDDRNFIAFLISGDGYMSLREMRNDQWIDREPWRTWPHVQRDSQANRLRADCAADRCTFFVNDEITLQENHLPVGSTVGLVAYPIELATPPAPVIFDQALAVQPAVP